MVILLYMLIVLFVPTLVSTSIKRSSLFTGLSYDQFSFFKHIVNKKANKMLISSSQIFPFPFINPSCLNFYVGEVAKVKFNSYITGSSLIVPKDRPYTRLTEQKV